jgi:hypothetical protein
MMNFILGLVLFVIVLYVVIVWIVLPRAKVYFIQTIAKKKYEEMREQIRKEKAEYEKKKEQEKEEYERQQEEYCYFPVDGDLINWKHGIVGMGAVLEIEFHPNPSSGWINLVRPFKRCEIRSEHLPKGVMTFIKSDNGDIIELIAPLKKDLKKGTAAMFCSNEKITICYDSTEPNEPWNMKLYTRDPVIPDIIKQCGNTLHFKQGQRLK